MGQFLVVTEFEVTILVVFEVILEMPEMAIDAVVVVGVTDKHELAAAGQGVKEGMVDQVHALLLVQPAHVRYDRAAGLAQPEPVPERLLVLLFALDGVGRITGRQERVFLGVPCVVVDTVKDAAELLLILLKGAAEPGTGVTVQPLAGVAGG